MATTTAATTANATTFAFLRKDVPEAEGFVAGAGDDGATVGAHAEVQHAVSVARERDDLRHAGVLPDIDGVLGVAVGADEFGCCRAKEEVAYLAACVVGAEEVGVQGRIEA